MAATPVRVIGRIDLAEQICDAVRSAGFEGELVTAAPMSVYGGTAPAEGVDVVVATSMFDPWLWRIAKRKHPLRPMVAVAERRRERALRGALLRRHGPDAYVAWPASAEDLSAAIRRAQPSTSRQRRLSFADVRPALVYLGFVGASLGGGVGLVVAGVGLLLGLPSAWNVRWQEVGGVILTLLGAAGVALHVVQSGR